MQKCRLITCMVLGMATVLMGSSPILLLASDPPASTEKQAATSAEAAAKPAAESNDQINTLKQQIALQQKQVEQMQKALDDQKRLLERLLDPAATTQQAAAPQTPNLGQVASAVPIARADADSGSSMEAKAPSSVAPATTASAVEALRQQIDIQQKQIEKLQSSLNQQQLELDKKTGAAGDPQSASKAAPQKFELPAALKGFHPIGLFYISYQNGTAYSGVPGKTTGYNFFQLKRGYFGADVDITSYLTARFVSDITSDSTGDVKLRAKYMYGKFHWKGNEAISSPYMEFGLAHMPWLDFEEAINGFRMQDTMFLERNSIFNSADIGVLVGSDFGGSMGSDYKSKVNSHYAGKYGSWQVGVYNGGGYHATEQNKNKVLEGRVTVRPVPSRVAGLQFTAFGIIGKGNQATNPPDWRVFDGMVSYESQYFTFTGQGFVGRGNQAGTAVNSDGTGAVQRGFSAFAAVHIPTPKIGGKISLLGRADEMNTNTAVYNDIKRLYIAGVAWHFYKSNIWLIDYQRTNHSVSTIPGEDRAQITLQVGF
jgi:hypothetical protein